AKHVQAPVPHVKEFVDVSSELDAAVHRGMAKEPSRRFSSAAVFAHELSAAPQATVPVDATVHVRAAPSETVSLGTRPDFAKVALLGPLWPWVKRVRDRGGRGPGWLPLAVLCAFLVVIAMLAFLTPGTRAVAVTNV